MGQNNEELKGMHVLIYGAGKSGIGTADLACACGAFPLIYDEKASLSGEELKKKLRL